jgi:hypothetical protein
LGVRKVFAMRDSGRLGCLSKRYDANIGKNRLKRGWRAVFKAKAICLRVEGLQTQIPFGNDK